MKKLISSVLMFMLFICNNSLVSANELSENINIKNSKGNFVNVNIQQKAIGKITKKEILEIVNENTDSKNITIYEAGYTKKNNRVKRGFPVVLLETKKRYTKKNVFYKDVFIDSCAKGETKTVTRSIEASIEASVSGNATVADLGLTGSLTYVMEKGKELCGPDEDSDCNTREFRCKFYINKGKWSQYLIGDPSGDAIYSGSFKEPRRFVSYSKDRIEK